MQIQRHYYDEEDWEDITEEEAKKSLEKFFYPAEPLLEDLAMGLEVYTDVAEYRAE